MAQVGLNVARSVGIECVQSRWQIAIEAIEDFRLGLDMDHSSTQGSRRFDMEQVEFHHSDATAEPEILSAMSHIYMFDKVFSDQVVSPGLD